MRSISARMAGSASRAGLILVDEGLAVQQLDRGGVGAVHLGRDHLARHIGPADIEVTLLGHPDDQRLQIIGGQALLHHAVHRVDRGVGAGAGGIDLEPDALGFPALAQTGRAWFRRRTGRCRVLMKPPNGASMAIGAAGEALFRQGSAAVTPLCDARPAWKRLAMAPMRAA